MNTGGIKSRIWDEKNRPPQLEGTVKLRAHLGNKEEEVSFFIAERLSDPVMLGCDLRDKDIKAIRPRKRTAELEVVTTVPVVRKPTRNSGTQESPKIGEEYTAAKDRVSNKI